MPRKHNLDVSSEIFDDLVAGERFYEYDIGYRIGDEVEISETSPFPAEFNTKRYTGRAAKMRVIEIRSTRSPEGVVLRLEKI